MKLKAALYKALIVVMVMAFVCTLFCSCGKEAEISVSVDILKIGKADCIIIDTGSNIIMIDTGEEENLDTVRAYMSKKGYDRVDMLILTHYDKDHIGGASEIISEYNVTTVIESVFTSNDEWYAKYHQTMDSLGITPTKLSKDYSLTVDGCQIDISVPKEKEYSEKKDNNSSLVVSMECGEKRMLFCADAMELRLEELIEELEGPYDFVKLPYHGNYLDNYREFLEIIKPTYGAITCSKKNPASEETLSLLDELEITAYQTRNGQITVITDGKELIVKQ
ncbi:MAG: MBL fold metallo-hydrolase [Clostridia bacterium]|nr:MBL fold metallo-hydrolase [Clostridia bacterium]